MRSIMKRKFNSAGKQSHQYQQKEWSPFTSVQGAQKRPQQDGIGNPGPCLGQAQ